jgi:hypothetical protein
MVTIGSGIGLKARCPIPESGIPLRLLVFASHLPKTGVHFRRDTLSFGA